MAIRRTIAAGWPAIAAGPASILATRAIIMAATFRADGEAVLSPAALGITAIWVAPIFVNKPVQGGPGQQSAGYHGYWITDFTYVDPAFRHRCGVQRRWSMRRACPGHEGIYGHRRQPHGRWDPVSRVREARALASIAPGGLSLSAPRRRERRADQSGFAGDAVQTVENFREADRSGYAYTPFVLEAEKAAKHPALAQRSDLLSQSRRLDLRRREFDHGDFIGLDDLMTGIRACRRHDRHLW